MNGSGKALRSKPVASPMTRRAEQPGLATRRVSRRPGRRPQPSPPLRGAVRITRLVRCLAQLHLRASRLPQCGV
jgi:hypothetical protein